jgi:aldose 1-epimerase
MNIEKSFYGTLSDGQAVDIYTLSNNKGMTVKILNYGGIIQSIELPVEGGKKIDVVWV